MSEQKLIAESRTFEQQMIERDKRATKAGFVVGGMGLLIAVLALVAVVVILPLEQTDVELYTLDNHAGRVEHVPYIENQPDRNRSLSKGDGRKLRQSA